MLLALCCWLEFGVCVGVDVVLICCVVLCVLVWGVMLCCACGIGVHCIVL